MSVFTFAGQFSGYRSLQDRSLKLTIETQEASPELMANLQKALMQVGIIAFAMDKFTTKELDELDNVKVDYDEGGKTPGQRLRAVLYRMYEQNNERYDTFIDYYNAHMEKLITHFKNKLA